MKSTVITLILVVLIQFCHAAKDTILPEEPWRALVFMEKDLPASCWKNDISIKLFGNFTPTDSLMIEHSIKLLNDIIETIQIKITSKDRGNLEIFFLDSTNAKDYESIIQLRNNEKSTWSYNFNTYRINDKETHTAPMHFKLAICPALVPVNYRQNFLTNTLAHALYPKYLDVSYVFKNGREISKRPISIFSPMNHEGIQPYYLELSPFDRQLIKTVYTSNFSELLPIAKKQFYLLPSWWRMNSKKILFLPLVLALFLFTGLIILFYKKLGVKIQNRLLKFNVVSILALLIVGVLASLYYVTAENLRDPYFSFFNILDIAVSILVLIVLGLPALNVIRLIELAIHRKAQHKYFKVLLLFLSTSLIPSGTVFSIVYFLLFLDNTNLGNEVVNNLLIVFLSFIIIGIIRALVSFFILKEKEAKIENEVKLANLRELKSKAELNALHSKINPHFLYNALNSIAGLAKTDADKTEKMALSLSKLFRYSINKEQSDWSSFSDEMEMVRIYLDIEKVRFDDRLEFTIDLPDELKTVKVPRFIIQPLVENSVKHGISKLVAKGEISASVRRNDKWIEIVVADNGPGFPLELAPGFGLQSIYNKLEIMYPDRFEMHFINTPDKHILLKLG